MLIDLVALEAVFLSAFSVFSVPELDAPAVRAGVLVVVNAAIFECVCRRVCVIRRDHCHDVRSNRLHVNSRCNLIIRPIAEQTSADDLKAQCRHEAAQSNHVQMRMGLMNTRVPSGGQR
jgi:hypothetical protein